MCGQTWERLTLFLLRQVKETVLGDNAVKCLVQVKQSNVGKAPVFAWPASPGNVKHRFGTVHSGKPEPLRDQPGGNRLSPATTEIEHLASARECIAEAGQPSCLEERSRTLPIISFGVSLVSLFRFVRTRSLHVAFSPSPVPTTWNMAASPVMEGTAERLVPAGTLIVSPGATYASPASRVALP